MEKNEPNLQSSAFLRDALIDAEILLSHASEYGISIEPQYIKAIVAAKKNEQIGSWTEQEEIDFWIAFQVLSKAIYPVSIDSLRAATEPKNPNLSRLNRFLGRKKRSLVENSVNWYRRFALIAMIIMLALQIYSLIGTALMAKVNAGDARMIEIEQRMQTLMLIATSSEGDKSASMEKSGLEQEIDKISQEVQTGIQLLDDWLNFTVNIFSKDTKGVTLDVQVLQGSVTDGPPVETGNTANLHNIVIIQKAKSLVIILNQYMLPLLYGFLGGFAFVLREISNETKSMTYTPTSNIKYGLRIHLGALAGLVIGFLWGDLQGKSFGVVESLSPLAVAFLAGYSVDFLFRVLDSVIGSAGKKITETTAGDQSLQVKK